MNRLGIDTGGTFTDAILFAETDIYTYKTPTTDDLLTGILTAATGVCDEAGIALSDVTTLNHGSTIALNTVLEETGEPTALITTEGFSDVLEIGEGFRDSRMLYSPCGEHEDPLIPREFRYDVTERIDAQGTVTTPLDDDHVDHIIEELRDADIRSVAVCLLHSYENPVHEEAIADRLASALPDISIDISSQTSPRIREYPRLCTTTISAYVKPRIEAYLSALQARFDEHGLDAPINIMQSDGGMARAEVAGTRPFTQIISGPVAGVKGVQFISDTIDRSNVITFDMGGTSCDTSLIADSELVEKHTETIRDMVVNGPIVDVDTIGAGGGSIAWVNETGALRVGPRSAGADPGPVCYGNGGVHPTVTDADLLLGFLNPENFAGGSIRLDESAASTSIQERIAQPLGVRDEEAALAIRRVIDSKMASAVRVKSVQQGLDPRSFSLVGYGGAGPLHAGTIATELGITELVFPNNPGLLSAFGLTIADIHHAYEHALVKQTTDLDPTALTRRIDALIDRGHTALTHEGIPPEDQVFHVYFDMMYAGQAHQLSVPVIADRAHPSFDTIAIDQQLLETVTSRFEHHHGQLYGFTDDATPIEVVTCRIVAEGITDNPGLPSPSGRSTADDAMSGRRSVLTDGPTEHDVPVFEWTRLPEEVTITGPALIESDNTTAWIPPAFSATTDTYLNIIATRDGL